MKQSFVAALVACQVILVALFTPSCALLGHPPSSLSPAGVTKWQANRVVVELITIQRAAIALNELTICPQPGDPTKCYVALSETNTRAVIDACEDAGLVLKAVPDGWKQTAAAAIRRIRQRLDARGHEELDPYLAAAETLLANLEKRRY